MCLAAVQSGVYISDVNKLIYCGISTDCSAVVTCDGLEQMGRVFEVGVTMWHSNKTVQPVTATGWGQRVWHRNVLYSGKWWHNHQDEGVDEDLWWYIVCNRYAMQQRNLFFGVNFLFRVKCHPIRSSKWPVTSARSILFIAWCDEWPNSWSKYHSTIMTLVLQSHLVLQITL